MNIKHGFLIGFALTIGIITWNDIKLCKTLPWPPRFIAAAIVFGLLDLFSLISEELAGVIAIGIVLAAFVQKGFVSDCNHQTTGTVQPGSSEALNPGDQPTSGETLV